MKNHLRILFPLLAMLVAACAGTAARQKVLLPSLRNAWPPIRVQVEREAGASESVDVVAPVVAAANSALAVGDPVLVGAVDWPLLERLADGDVQRRVDDGTITIGIAESLRERLAQFHSALVTYTEAR